MNSFISGFFLGVPLARAFGCTHPLARVGWLLSVVEVLSAPVLRSDALARTSASIPHASSHQVESHQVESHQVESHQVESHQVESHQVIKFFADKQSSASFRATLSRGVAM
jgi:hypothetical protein